MSDVITVDLIALGIEWLRILGIRSCEDRNGNREKFTAPIQYFHHSLGRDLTKSGNLERCKYVSSILIKDNRLEPFWKETKRLGRYWRIISSGGPFTIDESPLSWKAEFSLACAVPTLKHCRDIATDTLVNTSEGKVEQVCISLATMLADDIEKYKLPVSLSIPVSIRCGENPIIPISIALSNHEKFGHYCRDKGNFHLLYLDLYAHGYNPRTLERWVKLCYGIPTMDALSLI
jgi:hypothetical protein